MSTIDILGTKLLSFDDFRWIQGLLKFTTYETNDINNENKDHQNNVQDRDGTIHNEQKNENVFKITKQARILFNNYDEYEG